MSITRTAISDHLAALSIFGAGISASGSAVAFNWDPHYWSVRAVTAAMHDVATIQEWSPYEPPIGVSEEEYGEYLEAITDAWYRLNGLRTGLPAVVGDRSRCEYDESYSWAELERVPISDFRYFVDRHFEDGCNLVDLPCDQRHRALGAVLGWHAAEVDSRVNDIGLWFRPTNAGYFCYLNELTTPSTTSQQVWTMFRLGRGE